MNKEAMEVLSEHERDVVKSYARILRAIAYGDGEGDAKAAAILTLAANIDRGVMVWKGAI